MVEPGQIKFEYRKNEDTFAEATTALPPHNRDLLNASEAANYLGISVHKVSRLIRSGRLPVYATPFDRRQRLVFRSDLDALRADLTRLGNAWPGPGTDPEEALTDLYDRLSYHGVAPGPNGYDLPALLAATENYGLRWAVEKPEGERGHYRAVVGRRYHSGRGRHSVDSVAPRPEVALARALAEALDEGSGDRTSGPGRDPAQRETGAWITNTDRLTSITHDQERAPHQPGFVEEHDGV